MIIPAAGFQLELVLWPGKESLKSNWETKGGTTRNEGAPQAEEAKALQSWRGRNLPGMSLAELVQAAMEGQKEDGELEPTRPFLLSFQQR